ncbi:MAG: hypothetical protein GQ574_23670 [Crocinitomix sp.]|nr:hypothetical protein [Crocinitomix sp.]
MKYFLSISFLIFSFSTDAQKDSIAIYHGNLPAAIFIKGYPHNPSTTFGFGGSSIYNFSRANYTIYNSSDSSRYNGTVYSYNNQEKYSGTYFFYDEVLSEFEDGMRIRCKTTTYHRWHDHGTEKFDPEVSATNLVYYSDKGSQRDSSYYSLYDRNQELITFWYTYLENDHQIRSSTNFKNGDATFQAEYIDDIPHGMRMQSLFTYNKNHDDTIIKFNSIYDHGNLVDVLSDNVLYLGHKNEIIDKKTFFETLSYLEKGRDNFKFLAMRDQLKSITTDYEIILTLNHKNFSHNIPKRALNRIIRKYAKLKKL